MTKDDCERDSAGECIKIGPYRLKTVETHKNLESAFRSWQKEHPNFITPDILKLTQKGNTIIELAEGRDSKEKITYGVSAISWDEGKGTFETIDKPQVGLYYSLSKARAKASELEGTL